MGPFSIQSGTGGVHQNGYVLGVICQYGYNIKYSYEASACFHHEGYIDRINLLKPQSKHPVCIAIMGLLFGGHLPIKGYVLSLT